MKTQYHNTLLLYSMLLYDCNPHTRTITSRTDNVSVFQHSTTQYTGIKPLSNKILKSNRLTVTQQLEEGYKRLLSYT